MYSYLVDQEGGLNIGLQLCSYFVCASREGSGKTAWIDNLVCSIAFSIWDKNQNLINWFTVKIT